MVKMLRMWFSVKLALPKTNPNEKNSVKIGNKNKEKGPKIIPNEPLNDMILYILGKKKEQHKKV
jgi:hypothetical protein